MTISLPAEARCLKCSYLLQGLAEARCPECGTAFDPADEESFRVTGKFRPWLQTLSPRAARNAANVVIVTCTLALLGLPPFVLVTGYDAWLIILTLSVAGAARLLLMSSLVLKLLALPGLLVAGFCLILALHFLQLGLGAMLGWFTMVVALGGVFEFLPRWPSLHLPADPSDPSAGPVLGRWTRRALVVVLVLFWLNVIYPICAGRLSFVLSARAFSAKAQQVRAAGRGDLQPQFVGLWPVDSIVLRPRGTVEFLSTSDSGQRGGIIYVPPGQELGWPIRTVRMWPGANWYFFRVY